MIRRKVWEGQETLINNTQIVHTLKIIRATEFISLAK